MVWWRADEVMAHVSSLASSPIGCDFCQKSCSCCSPGCNSVRSTKIPNLSHILAHILIKIIAPAKLRWEAKLPWWIIISWNKRIQISTFSSQLDSICSCLCVFYACARSHVHIQRDTFDLLFCLQFYKIAQWSVYHGWVTSAMNSVCFCLFFFLSPPQTSDHMLIIIVIL